MPIQFTPAQANRTLPLVKRIVADILDKGQELRRLLKEAATPDPVVRELEHRLRDLMRELEKIGCYYKDWGFDKGLVDFPARIENEDVFLCWRSDEPEVTWYHPVAGGFSSRKLIPEALLEKA